MNDVTTYQRRSVVEWLNSDRIVDQVRRALPDHLPIDWFMRCAQTALLNEPKLASAEKGSLLRELVAVAQLGLVTDPQLGEAWLIVDRHGNVQRRVGYQGLRKLVLQSNLVGAPSTQAVYEFDHVEIELGDDAHVKHSIDPRVDDRGKLLGCWARAKILSTGETVVEWMSWGQIEAHRNRYSDAYRHPDPKKRGPWGDPLSEIEMGRKTVLRRLCKTLPKSPLLADVLAHEDRADMRDITPGSHQYAELPAPSDPDPVDPVDLTSARPLATDAASATSEAAPPQSTAKGAPGDGRPEPPDRTGDDAGLAQSSQDQGGGGKPKRERRSYRRIANDAISRLAKATSDGEVDAIVRGQVTSGVRANTELMAEINAAERDARERIETARKRGPEAAPAVTVLGEPAPTWEHAVKMVRAAIEKADQDDGMDPIVYEELIRVVALMKGGGISENVMRDLSAVLEDYADDGDDAGEKTEPQDSVPEPESSTRPEPEAGPLYFPVDGQAKRIGSGGYPAAEYLAQLIAFAASNADHVGGMRARNGPLIAHIEADAKDAGDDNLLNLAQQCRSALQFPSASASRTPADQMG